MSTHDPADLHTVAFDLTTDEARRRAAVLAALGDTWDPVEVLRSEQQAHDLLYSGLDEEQQRTLDMLVAAGVLPPRESGRAAD
ncbi:DUF6400 family protein [Streptomyces sp. TR06-5]|uniref:DUF6400 family protein n=1 Tax=unclassified Streptomyces TaxID=2593676 RepID=UPI0039A107C1